MSHKQKDLIEMYEAMSEAVNSGNLGNETVQKKIVAELEKTNIDVCAMDISDDGKVVFTNVKEEIVPVWFDEKNEEENVSEEERKELENLLKDFR